MIYSPLGEHIYLEYLSWVLPWIFRLCICLLSYQRKQSNESMIVTVPLVFSLSIHRFISRIRYLPPFSFNHIVIGRYDRYQTFISCQSFDCCKSTSFYLCSGTQFIQPYGLTPEFTPSERLLSSARDLCCVFQGPWCRGDRSNNYWICTKFFSLNLFININEWLGIFLWAGEFIPRSLSMAPTFLQWLSLHTDSAIHYSFPDTGHSSL